MILNKDHHFQFIAFKTTGDPDSNVHQCLQSLFQLIPDLSNHIEILDSNEEGNIQYIVKNQASRQQTSDNNPFRLLQCSYDDDDESTDDTHQQPPTDSPLPPCVCNVSPIKYMDNTPTRIFKGAYIEATSTLDAIEKSAQTHTDPHLPSETTEFVANICSIYATIKSSFEHSCKQQISEYQSIPQTVASEHYEIFNKNV